MGIPIGKLSSIPPVAASVRLYPSGGVDVDQQPTALNDPLYMGWLIRVSLTMNTMEFVDELIQAVKQRWTDVLLQFEDFAQKCGCRYINAIAMNGSLTMTFRHRGGNSRHTDRSQPRGRWSAKREKSSSLAQVQRVGIAE